MPHYKDGTVALPGDIAKGKGYNIPHEITGVVLQVFPSDSCNLRIAVTKMDDYGTPKDAPGFRQVNGCVIDPGDGKDHNVGLYVESGSVQEFELVHRPTQQGAYYK